MPPATPAEMSSPTARRPGVLPLALVLGTQFAFLAAVLGLATFYAPASRLIGQDALATPGEEVELQVQLEPSFPRGSLLDTAGVGVLITGDSGDTSLRTLTNRAGKASVSVRAPEAAGSYRYRAAVEQASLGVALLETEFQLEVTSSERPLILVSVRGLISSPPRSPASPGRDKTRRDAAGATSALSRNFQVAYVVTTPLPTPTRLRPWLAENSFAPGPIFFAPTSGRWEKLTEFLNDRFGTRLRNAWGVSSDLSDARGFGLAGARAILVGAAAPPGEATPIRAASGWDDVARILERP